MNHKDNRLSIDPPGNDLNKAIQDEKYFDPMLVVGVLRSDNHRTKLWCLKFSKNATKLLLGFLP